MSSSDNDFEYKMRFQRVLWQMGFWVRAEVPVLAYSIDNYADVDKLKKHDLTDIDVYGESINLDFSISKYIADCKTSKSKNVKATERIFWLRGVMDHSKATKGFLVKKTVSSNIRLILDKLNIYAVDNANLSELEKLYRTDKIKSIYSLEYHQKREALILNLSDEYKKIYQFLSQRYWYNPNHVNLTVIQTMLNKDKFYSRFLPSDSSHTFLLLEAIIGFGRLLFECCNYILHRNIANIPQGVLEFVYGGVDGVNSKNNIIREMKTLIQKHLPNENFVITESDSRPAFYKPFLELVITLISEPAASRDVLRYLEVMQHETVTQKKYDFSDIFGSSFSAITLKLAKDVIRYYIDIAKINPMVFEEILKK